MDDHKTYEDGYRDGYADGFAEGRHFADDMLVDDNRQLRGCLRAILERGEAPERETYR